MRKWEKAAPARENRGYPVPKHCDPMRLTLPLAGSRVTPLRNLKYMHERRIMEEYCSDSGCVLLFNREGRDFAGAPIFLLDCSR